MARNKYDVDEELETPFNVKHIIRLMKYVKPYKSKIIITVILMFVASIANLLGPYLTKIAIDSEIPKKNVKGLILLSVIFVLTLLVNAVCQKWRIREMTNVGQSIILNIRRDIFTHIQKLPFSYFDSRPHGKILVRVVNYVNSLSDLLSNGIVNLLTDLFSLLVILVFMFIVDARLTLICMIGLPLLAIAIMTIKTTQRKRWQAVSRKSSNMNAYIHENIAGIKVTQSFVREEVNAGIFRNLSNAYRSAWMSAQRVSMLLWPTVEMISIMGTAAVYLIGVSWIGESITVGALIAFTSYISRFWAPISNLGNFYNQIINAMAYMERIFETIDEKLIVENLPGATEMPVIEGDVEFKNVSFKYEEDGNLILENMSFKVNKGDTIALVGPTGAGKTTTINLLSRFYDISGGQVLIDGIDIRTVTLESLRKQMGVMLQDTFIFSGTIMDNIRYGKLDATDEEVMEAAKAVKAHDFIIKLKDGYYTQVNERGSRLSVGQRQLISFARALLANPKILILDEATSSIDTETEMALQEGLERLLKGRTSFVIAHRLSTIKNSTRIMYIDNRGIVEQGTHDELIAKKGAYWKLYTAQFKFLEAAV
ncbi:multidrug ABC transporter ATP-binding protein [Clostridium thermosuccinogenes]|uniref:Multidrug ABC transporter ATP-binding protein n=1 Tax=Clostridium thermosuccinogenes TaxID=84032 RepID=A0A2K2FC95_9CLOT|nr:ABC transporter ATP-binding protein [Pseudoclostridium thermosuccinogenes]AUS96214.1 multidrug ABC transporter ATP-binding protein [Pseudoclostridium thermosuccinogenes]PNT96411.1 multidrug ABC transporter ATP-binding protein [Pseudoclostridium thermosuccinogenes]PNT98064.1 multidrug ABC transporter ATP-binding protein [Pseudoclostridium thermosuccinogenes]